MRIASAKVWDAVALEGGDATGSITCVDRAHTLVQATGEINVVARLSLADGDYFTLDDGVNAPAVFEFDDDSSVAPGAVAIDLTLLTTAGSVRDAVISAINGAAGLDITASSGGAAKVTLTQDFAGADHPGSAVTENVTDAGFTVSGMSGGTDGASAQTFTLNDGVNAAKVFEFDTDGSVGAGRVAVDLSGDVILTAADVAAAVVAAINGVTTGLRITATDNGDGTVSLIDDFGGSAGNHAITETVTDAGFVVSGMSAGTDIYSKYVNVEGLERGSFQYQWTSSNAVGTFTVEVSNNYDKARDTGDWDPWTPATTITNPSSNNGDKVIDLGFICFRWVRMKYVRTSGTGTLNAWFNGRGVG